MKYQNYEDNELLSYVEENNDQAKEAIFKKYEPYIVGTSQKIYKKFPNKVNGLELNDLIQEGLLGLSKAIHTYNDSFKTSFFTYATRCIDNYIFSLLIRNNRKKNQLLNESVSLEGIFDESEYLKDILLKDTKSSPEEQVIAIETENEILKKIRYELSNMETQIFDLYLSGLSYRDIANFLEKDPKIIDNTLTRIKIKVKNVIKEMESQE